MANPTIHRFPITSAVKLVKINMAAGAVILKAEKTSTGVSIFAMVDPEAEKTARYFTIVTTGESLPEWAWDARYHSIPGVAGLHILEVEAGHLKPQDKA